VSETPAYLIKHPQRRNREYANYTRIRKLKQAEFPSSSAFLVRFLRRSARQSYLDRNSRQDLIFDVTLISNNATQNGAHWSTELPPINKLALKSAMLRPFHTNYTYIYIYIYIMSEKVHTRQLDAWSRAKSDAANEAFTVQCNAIRMARSERRLTI